MFAHSPEIRRHFPMLRARLLLVQRGGPAEPRRLRPRAACGCRATCRGCTRWWISAKPSRPPMPAVGFTGRARSSR